MQIWNGSDEYCWRYRADTILSTDRQMDRRTDGQTDGRTDGQGETSISPFQLRWSGGYNLATDIKTNTARQFPRNQKTNFYTFIMILPYNIWVYPQVPHFQMNCTETWLKRWGTMTVVLIMATMVTCFFRIPKSTKKLIEELWPRSLKQNGAIRP